MAITIDILARTQQAQQQLAGLGKIVEKTQKLFAGMGSGRSSPSSNLQQMTKGMQQLSKAAEQAEAKWKLTARTLDDVSRKIKGLENGGSVLLSNKDQYKALLDQERSLQRQARTWQTIAANRQSMMQNAPPGYGAAAPPGGGSGGGGGGLFGLVRGVGGGLFSRATGGMTGAAGSLVGAGGAAAIEEAMGPIIGTLALAAIGAGVKGFQAALKQDEGLTQFLPRMFPGSMGGVVPSVMARRMGDAGRPFAFNREESIGTFQAMSEGGSGFGSKRLDRDATAAMQMARMFGVDPGGEASMLASAQRSGAFKAGDARRFASMLAAEIKRTGLSPRFEEAQQATLMLLNRQTQELGSANPGPVLALQAAFNRTGIPGLTGMNGANVIGRLQDSVSNPGGEANEALDFQVFRKMGAKSLYDIKYMQEAGINDPRYLHTLLSTVEGSAPNAHAADIALKEKTHGALSLHMLAKIRAVSGGRLSNFAGNLSDIEKSLGQGSGALLDKGAKSTTAAFPSLQIKAAQIMIHEATLAVGQPILNKVAGMAGKFAAGGEKLLTGGGATDASRTHGAVDAAADAAGVSPEVRKKMHAAAGAALTAKHMLVAFKRHGALGGLVNEWINGGLAHEMEGMFPTGPTSGPGAKWHSGPLSLVKGAREFLGTPYVWGGTSMSGADCSGSMQSIFRQFGVSLPRLAHDQANVGQRIAKNQLRPGDLMFFNTGQGADHHVGMYAGDGKVIHASSGAGRVVEVPFTGWLANHFSHGQRIQVEVSVNHPAFKAHIKETMHEIHHENTRAHPNTRNPR
jgi:hypothetical protein